MQEQIVINYYVLCNKLKDVIRTGWKVWQVPKERLESVAEHIYGTQMLAIAMYSEYKYDIDLKKALMMLAIHETEEILIGDLTMFQVTREEKEKIGHDAINKVFGILLNKEELINLVMEFDARKTKEALFAYYCDKMEADIQCKLYDEMYKIDMKDNRYLSKEEVQNYEEFGNNWSKRWIYYGLDHYDYDENFKKISNYLLNNKITDEK